MTQRDPAVSLRQMLDYAQEALTLAAGKSQVEIETDRVLTLALTHLLEILGEAANRVPPLERAKYPAIPWHGVISLRNRLVHGYDTVSIPILWRILQDDVPPLVASLQTIVSNER
jgi:uncharacterized protein with HEPN domain